MTNPQPSNQLPEEVKRALHDACADLHQFQGDLTFDAILHGLTTALTPYLTPRPVPSFKDTHPELISEARDGLSAPRPPASRDAEWAVLKHIETELFAGFGGQRPAWAADLLEYIERAKSDHAPADSASAQLAAMREERDEALAESKYRGEMVDSWRKSYEERLDEVYVLRTELAAAQAEVGRLTGEATCHFMDIEAAIGKGRLLGGWRTATSEIATLRRERDAFKAARDFEAENLKAALKERDELRADKERLDWLENGGCEVLCHKPADDDTDQRPVFWVRGYLDGTPRTLRAALDSARAKQGEGQP